MDPNLYIYIGIGVGVIFLIAMIIGISATKSRVSEARSFGPNFCKLTGLQNLGDSFHGLYKGHLFNVRGGVGRPTLHGTFGHMKGSHVMKTWPVLHCKLQLPDGTEIPYTVLREKLNMLLFTDQVLDDKISQRYKDLPPELPALEHKLPRVHLYSMDEGYANRLAQDSALKYLLSNWFYTDIRISGNLIYLYLDNEHVLAKYGRRLQSPNYWVEAMDICVRIAELSSDYNTEDF